MVTVMVKLLVVRFMPPLAVPPSSCAITVTVAEPFAFVADVKVSVPLSAIAGATLLFLIVAASMYSRMLGLSGLPNELATMFENSGLGFHGLLTIYVIIVLILGCIIDSASIMLIMVPLFIASGRQSMNYPESMVCKDLRLFHAAGMNVTLRQYPGVNDISELILGDVDRWIMEVIASDKQATVVST